eukprot:scaffold2868_cov171-Amphora_coffeaeformis.AAC.11
MKNNNIALDLIPTFARLCRETGIVSVPNRWNHTCEQRNASSFRIEFAQKRQGVPWSSLIFCRKAELCRIDWQYLMVRPLSVAWRHALSRQLLCRTILGGARRTQFSDLSE